MIGEDEQLTLKSKVDFARLPPCSAAFVPHNQRVNHRTATFKHACDAIVEMPKAFDEGQEWKLNDDNVLEPILSNKPNLPLSLVDLLKTGINIEEKNDQNIEEEDFDLFESDDEI